MTEIMYAGIVDNSTIDYPHKNSAVVYLCGCPYRCPWCQNKDLLTMDSPNCRKTNINEIITELNKNYLIQAVCVTGGEPMMQEETITLLKKIKKETDLLLKIDSNCFYPNRLSKAIKYLDYFTTDIKAPLDIRYGKVTGLPDRWEQITKTVKESHKILKDWINPKEARTTIIPGLLETKEEIIKVAEIIADIGFTEYTIQQFRPENTLDPAYEKKQSPSRDKLIKLAQAAKAKLPETNVQIVTLEGGFEQIKTTTP